MNAKMHQIDIKKEPMELRIKVSGVCSEIYNQIGGNNSKVEFYKFDDDEDDPQIIIRWNGELPHGLNHMHSMLRIYIEKSYPIHALIYKEGADQEFASWFVNEYRRFLKSVSPSIPEERRYTCWEDEKTKEEALKDLEKSRALVDQQHLRMVDIQNALLTIFRAAGLFGNGESEQENANTVAEMLKRKSLMSERYYKTIEELFRIAGITYRKGSEGPIEELRKKLEELNTIKRDRDITANALQNERRINDSMQSALMKNKKMFDDLFELLDVKGSAASSYDFGAIILKIKKLIESQNEKAERLGEYLSMIKDSLMTIKDNVLDSLGGDVSYNVNWREGFSSIRWSGWQEETGNLVVKRELSWKELEDKERLFTISDVFVQQIHRAAKRAEKHLKRQKKHRKIVYRDCYWYIHEKHHYIDPKEGDIVMNDESDPDWEDNLPSDITKGGENESGSKTLLRKK